MKTERLKGKKKLDDMETMRSIGDNHAKFDGYRYKVTQKLKGTMSSISGPWTVKCIESHSHMYGTNTISWMNKKSLNETLFEGQDVA